MKVTVGSLDIETDRGLARITLNGKKIDKHETMGALLTIGELKVLRVDLQAMIGELEGSSTAGLEDLLG